MGTEARAHADRVAAAAAQLHSPLGTFSVRGDHEHFAYVGAWEWAGKGSEPVLHREHLDFDYVKRTQRSYK